MGVHDVEKARIRAAARAQRKLRRGLDPAALPHPEGAAPAARSEDLQAPAPGEALGLRDAWVGLLHALGLPGPDSGEALPALFIPTRLEPDIGLILAAHPRALLPALADERGEPLDSPAWTEWESARGPGALTAAGPRRPTSRLLRAPALSRARVILLPALAVDPRGTRIGQGGGWYDRALLHADPGAPVVAAIHDGEWHEEPLPRRAHDRRVDAVISPSGFRILDRL